MPNLKSKDSEYQRKPELEIPRDFSIDEKFWAQNYRIDSKRNRLAAAKSSQQVDYSAILRRDNSSVYAGSHLSAVIITYVHDASSQVTTKSDDLHAKQFHLNHTICQLIGIVPTYEISHCDLRWRRSTTRYLKSS